ncbi:TIGR03792 family protein [Leptolyngbya sp. FACHB-261]|uniref:TIGR03792 family protein n=1 Tax=Leptolyngbya sp. FACHB-261 TaxID=2692806 RepID=UPI001683FD77|nr:TIGR03792 family protein [Leptolyngbya sp. FACHB-261]MBD2101193.1 TIGR03792 family protein [Leptolyngbya sp. FACHB-261]
MVIEWLRFRMRPEQREAFIQRDAEVWTAGLQKFPGFLGKEIWIDPNQSTDVVAVTRWETREQWKTIPQSELDALDRRMGDLLIPIAESREYQIRKFAH